MSSNAIIEQSAREHPSVPPTAAVQADHAAYTNATFANHSQPGLEGPGANRTSPASAGHPMPHAYSHPQPTQNESHIHPELRSLEAVAAASGYPPVPSMIPPGLPPPDQAVAMSGPPVPVAQSMTASDEGDGADGRKAKRELSQSKRAAQNRAAQRAFRQRKEGYIKKLEQQVKDYNQMESGFKTLQDENYALKDYAIILQSRLAEVIGDYPPPPQGIMLSHPHPHPPRVGAGGAAPEPPQQNMGPAGPGANSLEVAAQAVAGLSRSEHHLAGRGGVGDPYAVARGGGGVDDDARTAEEITRQMQADGNGPDGLPAAPM